MADKKDKEHSTNDEVKRNEKFQDNANLSWELYELVKELVDSETEKVFKSKGYERIEKPTSTYATGKPYGYGAEEGKFQLRYAGKTKANIEKQIFLGAKRLEAQINMDLSNGMFTIEYTTPESGFFRGVTNDRKTYMVHEKLILSTKNMSELKKELKKLFSDAAKKELGYITSTKLGVEDRTDVSTTSIVENINAMEKLTLKDIFSEEVDENVENLNEMEDFEELPDEEKNIEKVIDLNTQPANGDGNSVKYILFDDEVEEESNYDMDSQYADLSKEEYNQLVRSIMQDKFGTTDMNALTPVEKKDLFMTLDMAVKSQEEIQEITTAGPAGAGAGRYDTKHAWAATGDLKNSKDKKKKNPTSKSTPTTKAGDPFTVPANDPMYEGGNIHESTEAKAEFKQRLDEEKSSKLRKTSYGKSKANKRPKIDKDYNVIPETEKQSTHSSKPYVVVPKIDPGYHPLGMPGVEVNSQEEFERTAHSGVGQSKDHDKYERMGIAQENEIDKKQRLIKRKFSSGAENLKEGVNKKYIITEQTTEEYERERWSRLASFKPYETILNAEENLINEASDLEESANIDSAKKVIEEQVINEHIEASNNEPKEEKEIIEETVLVEKPSSNFGTCYKFYKKDFLNENKNYILDINSMTFVPNPNRKQ